MRLSMLVSLALLLASCDRSTAVSVDIQAMGTPAVAFYEVALFQGATCPDAASMARGARAAVLSVSFPEGSPMGLGERRESGPHALAVLGRASDCTPVSFGCTSLELGETDEVNVPLGTLESFSGSVCGARACQAGRCVGGRPDGGTDGGVDASFDGGPDATVDGGATCGSCGDPAVTRCVSGSCQLVEVTPEVRDTVSAAPVDVLNAVRLAHTTGPLSVHVGTLEAAAGGAYRAVVTTLPLATLDGTPVRTELPENAPLALAGSLALQGDENTLHWSVAGRTDPLSTVGVWIGTIITPGTLETSLALTGPNTEVGLGPQQILGGNGRPIRYVSVTRDEGSGVLQVGSVPPTPVPADYRPWPGPTGPIPGGSAQSAASAGGVVVMEFFGTRNITVWRPDPGIDTQVIETRVEGSTGPLGLADLGGERYLLAHPIGNSVRLVATDCDAECTFVTGGTTVSSGDTLQALAVVGTPNEGALLVEGIESAGGARVTLRPVNREAEAGEPIPLWTRPANERVVALAADWVSTPAAYELLIAAVSQNRDDATAGRIGLIRVPFPR
ncbi:MAG: hypothetical protein AB8I08_37400 [Sandaracinaceae bacterium]